MNWSWFWVSLGYVFAEVLTGGLGLED